MREVQSVWRSSDDTSAEGEDIVIISKKDDDYVAVSSVDNYIYRPEKYAHISLYDWNCLAIKNKMNKIKDVWSHQNREDIEHESDIQDDQ